MECDLRLDGPWRDEVSSRKTGEKIVEGDLIRHVHHRQFSAQGVAVSLPDAVSAQGNVEQVSGSNPGWVGIRVVGSIGYDVNEGSAALWRIAGLQRLRNRRKYAAAIQSDCMLFVPGQSQGGSIVWNADHHQTAVEAPS